MPHPEAKGVPDQPPISIHDEDIEWLPSAKPQSSDLEIPISVEPPSSDVLGPEYPEEVMSTVKIDVSPKDERGHREVSASHDAFAQTVRRPFSAPDQLGVEVIASPQRPLPPEPRGFLPEEEEAPASKSAVVEIETAPQESNRFRGMAFNREEDDEDEEIPVSIDDGEMPQSIPVQSGVRLKGAPSAEVVPLSDADIETPAASMREISGRAIAEKSAELQEEYRAKNIPPYAPSVLYPDGSEEGEDGNLKSGTEGRREAA